VRKLISLITLLSFSLQAATITDDKLTVGKKASASAKEIVFDTNDGAANKKLSVDKVTKKLSITSDETLVGDGTQSDKALTFNRGGSNAQVKWNELTDKLQFSNDGTTFKDLGTGGGGGGSTGVNVLTNDSFEDAVGGVLTDWSNTGGTLTQVSYTNSVEGDAKYFQFVATGAGQYFEMSKVVPTNFNGSGCQVDFKKLNIATADLFKVEALDGSNNVLATGNVKISSWQKFPTLSFVCPAAGSTFKIRVTSLAAGTLQGDKAYLGSNQNLVYTTQARLLGTITWPMTALCLWSRTATTFGGFNADTDCPNPVVTGELQAPATKIPGFVLPKYLKGSYKIEASGSFDQGTNNATLAYRFFDGTNASKGSNSVTSEVLGVIVGQGYINGVIENGADQTNTTIQIQAAASTGSVLIENADRLRELSISVWYYPSASEVAVSPEQASWFIDANIGGQNPNLGIGSQTSYIEIPGTTLDLVNNTAKGSAPVEIACANGFASVGNTCGANNESIGIAFMPPGTGLYEACFSFSHNTNSANGMTSYFQVVETSNTSSAILTEGGQRIGGGHGNAISTISPQKVCGTFNFSDTSKKTLRLMYEQNATSGAASSVMADRSSGDGQRDISVTVRPILSAYNRPILVGGQNVTPGISSQNIDNFSFSYGTTNLSTPCTSSPCFLDQIGSAVTNVTRPGGTGNYTVNFSKTYINLKCVPSLSTASPNASIQFNQLQCSNCSSDSFTSSRSDSGVAIDSYGIFICQGLY
jgi:hypothetical protein